MSGVPMCPLPSQPQGLLAPGNVGVDLGGQTVFCKQAEP